MNKKIYNSKDENNNKSYNQKYIIENWFDFQLDSKYITDLIIQIKDDSYTKECIKNREKLGLGSSCVVRLIASLNDIEYMKECVENRKKLRLASYHIYKVIKETNDKDYIIECINNRKKLELGSYYVAELIKYTNDLKYILYCIEKYEENNFDSYVTTKLVEFVNDKEYTKQCINNSKNMGLSNEDITYLIKSTNDVDFIKKYINYGIKYGLNSENIVDLIIYMKDKNYTKIDIKHYEKLKLKQSDFSNLIIMTQDREYIHKYICSNKKESKETEKLKLAINEMDMEKEINKYNILDLPKNMTIGIEIEMVGNYSDMIEKSAIDLDNWKIKEDDTVKGEFVNEKGIEIVSPILKLDNNKRSTEKIIRILKILDIIGQHVNKSCGGHIHIGCNYLKSSMAYINLLEIWCKAEYIFYVIGNEEGSIPRGLEYSSPISKTFEKKIDKKLDFEQMKKEIVKIQGTKAKSINFINILPKGKGTIEFRLSNGTMDPNVWIQNVNLYGSILITSQRLSEVQKKYDGNRTNNEKELLKLFESFKQEKNEKNKLEILLNLLINDESKRKIYRDRYNINVQLLEDKKELNKFLKSKISENGIVLVD